MSSTDLEAPASVSKFASKLSTDTEMEAESAHLITADQLPESGVEEASNDTSQLSTSVATSQKDEETGSETPRSKPRYHSKISFDTIHKQIEPQHIVEYEWPLKSGERFFIQEQIAELLDLKSFKRKYPELTRHTVDGSEREHLFTNHKLNEVMPKHLLNHLTALRAIEVHELMAAEYPQIHAEYKKAVAFKAKQEMVEKQKELDNLKSDAKKLEELRKKAIKGAAEFNAELQNAKKNERKHFWDIQTSIIQSSANKWKKVPKEHTRPAPYPVALIPGQFTNYYKKFLHQQLQALPFGSVLKNEKLFPPKREQSPPPLIVTDHELQKRIEDEERRQQRGNEPEYNGKDMKMEKDPPSPPKTPKSAGNRRLDKRKASFSSASSVHADKCTMCAAPPTEFEPMIRCSTCPVRVHPSCIDMPQKMITVVQSYAWNCIECKNCTICMKPDQEDAMMCCDLCDRGYHTFCVGLNAPPTGTWICEKFCRGKKLTG
uniref:PHD-type domain-containing protein n=1 Tax=Acrobeloides nanus TaxID=290746 RepID=A0A914BVB8_9BILA